jgi:hypothetical protein
MHVRCRMYIHTQIPSDGTEVLLGPGEAATNIRSFGMSGMPPISYARSPAGFVRSLAHNAGRTFLIHVSQTQAIIAMPYFILACTTNTPTRRHSVLAIYLTSTDGEHHIS